MAPASICPMDISTHSPAFLDKIVARGAAAQALHALPRPWVFTNGVFDVLHRGHVLYLAQARALGIGFAESLLVSDSPSLQRLAAALGIPVAR